MPSPVWTNAVLVPPNALRSRGGTDLRLGKVSAQPPAPGCYTASDSTEASAFVARSALVGDQTGCSAPESRSGALIRTRIEDELFLANRPVPRCRSARRSDTPRAM